jgi:O-antigen/teichoic acid export membrane protein
MNRKPQHLANDSERFIDLDGSEKNKKLWQVPVAIMLTCLLLSGSLVAFLFPFGAGFFEWLDSVEPEYQIAFSLIGLITVSVWSFKRKGIW